MSARAHDSPAVSVERVISMTELQKLSLRKLREMRLDEEPLVVRDAKRRQRLFVILDHGAYERLVAEEPREERAACGLEGIDFAGRGLFWDRPAMTNERFATILEDPLDAEHRWAWSRALERLPSGVVTRAVGLRELRRIVSIAHLRPPLREAWEKAIGFWTEEAKRRLS